MTAKNKREELRKLNRNPVVLIVEDDEDLLMLFQRNFEKNSLRGELACATNGVSAIKYILDKGAPDLVITDLNMPYMSGYELISWIRTAPSTANVPVVVYSSMHDPEVAERCTKLGASSFLPKEGSTTRLNAFLERFFQSWKSNSFGGPNFTT